MGEPADTRFERIRLLAGSRERANVRPWPTGIAAPHAEWISFVRVFSTVDTVRKAVKLGGRALVGPTRDAHGATSAILEDPTGAAFGVMELPPEVVNIGTPSLGHIVFVSTLWGIPLLLGAWFTWRKMTRRIAGA